VFDGEAKPVYWKGYPVGEERVFSDGLLIFLLKTLWPEKYGNTKASTKRQTELKRKEQVFKKLLVDVQSALDHERRNETEILTRAGVPVPPRRYASASVGGMAQGQMSEDRGQMSEGGEQGEIKVMSKIKIKNGIGFEGGEESGSQGTEGRDQMSEGGSAGAPHGGEGAEQDQIMIMSKIMSKTGVGIECGGEGPGQRTEGGDQKAEDEGGEDAETGRRGDTESLSPGASCGVQGEEEGGDPASEEGIEAGKEAPQPPAGNAEGAGVAGNAPKEEALPGGENPECEKKPWRYDPYELSRKIREAEKARRMRRRQIDV
jgi:hypothetical protein